MLQSRNRLLRTAIAQLMGCSLPTSLLATAFAINASAAPQDGGVAPPAERSTAVQADAQEAPAASATDGVLDEVVVTSRIIFRENDAFGATKMGLALKETPQTVTVVTGDLIEVAGMRTFNDFYKVDASGGSSQAIDGFPRNYYRGFRQQGQNAIRVDGFRMPGNIDLDFATFDRFEVIKGPTSTLYGQSSIAGTLNAVSKLPQDEVGFELGVEAGQFDDYRIDADLTGPIGSSDEWSYRLIAAWEDADSFLDYAGDDLKVIAPSIQYKPNDSTRFILRATYQEKDIRLHFAPILQLAGQGEGDMIERVVSEGLKIPDVPRSRFFGMPWNNAQSEATFVQFQGEHTFDNAWQMRAHAQFNRVEYASDAFFAASPFDENGFAYLTYAYGHNDTDDLYGAEVDLFGPVQAFGREHTVFFGLDYNRIKTTSRYGSTQFSTDYADSIFNIFDPDYSAIPRQTMQDYPFIYDTDNETELYGATVQLIVRPMDRLSVLLGGRQSVSQMLVRDRTGSGGVEEVDQLPFETTSDFRVDKFTMQAGLTYEATDHLNLYASYGQTFEPKTDRVFEGEGLPGKLIDPEEGTNYEIGAKADLSPDLSLTAAIFQMERTNISQPDPVNRAFFLPVGTQRSRGAELGFQGRLSPELSIYGSLAYLDAEFTEGEFKGLQPTEAPRFGVSLFGTYEILEGDLKGLGFGLGVVHKSGRETFDATLTEEAGVPVTFDFGDFTEVDARVFYGKGRWTTSLAITNLFDEKYYSPAFETLTYGTHVNPPRTATLSVRYKL